MTTSGAAAATRPRRTPRALLLLGVSSLLVVLTVAARGDVGDTSATDLERIDDAVREGCARPGTGLDDGTGFAFDGTVNQVVSTRDRGPLRVALEVREWFLGPPVDQVAVWVDPTTVRYLTGQGGVDVAPGTRLLVSGRGWGADGDLPAAAGCGRTRVWDAGTAQQWRADLPTPPPATPAGPAARYPGAGYVRGGGDTPDLTGVLVRDAGCLYVQDGLTRWLPVFPAGQTSWIDGPPQLTVAGLPVDIGHAVRLAGMPASGAVSLGPGDTDPGDSRARSLDPRGVPERCDDAAPRFVVAEPAAGAEARATDVPADSAWLRTVVTAAEGAGLEPSAASGRNVRDVYGSQSGRVQLATPDGGEVLVHLETVAFLAWPFAYVPRDAELRWSLNPVHAVDLPTVPPGHQLAVVERADGITQVLVRTPGRVVASASADLLTTGGPLTDDGVGGVDALAQLALEVAVSSAGAGS